MSNLFRKILDFYLYSSIHIALAATSLVVQTYVLLDLKIDLHYILFIFFGTLFLYILHNIKGTEESIPDVIRDKIVIINKMKTPLLILIGLSAVVLIYNFFYLKLTTIIYLSILGFISIWYVVPVFGKQKRLRDYSIIKIFLIALVWATLSFIPLLGNEISFRVKALLFSQNYLYIFALTIPFDIRDYEYEKIMGLKTIPSLIGKKNSIILSLLLLTGSILIAFLLIDNYGSINFAALATGYFLAMVAIANSHNKTGDYYFTGLLDGMTIVIFILLLTLKLIVRY